MWEQMKYQRNIFNTLNSDEFEEILNRCGISIRDDQGNIVSVYELLQRISDKLYDLIKEGD